MSIGCAVYNGAETLRRALDGVVGQDYPSVEIIICDDQSTDESRAICREYAAKHANIRYVENEKNLGLVANFNKLFSLSRGKYFMWADQDDVRASTFVSKCVDVLESHPATVLCHSHTGVFFRTFDNLVHVNTIDSVAEENDIVKRYWRFLRTYSDTTIYGLIRSDVLRTTSLWRHAPGSSNALLFELLLRGTFRQVPEVLYFYQAKGPARPSPREEVKRGGASSELSWRVKPFMILAYNQARDILSAPRRPATKGLLMSTLGTNLIMVNGSKATFRALEAIIGRRVPRWFEQALAYAVADTRDIHFVAAPSAIEMKALERHLLRAR